MKKIFLSILPMLFFACREQVKEIKDSVDAIKQATEAVSKIKSSFDSLNLSSEEAKKFYAERKAKGDTIAMEHSKLITLLPASIDGMKPDGNPNGSTQNALGFSISVAERDWKQTDSANSPRIKISITDIGGKEESYSMMALPLMLNFSNDDEDRRTNVFKPNLPHTIMISDFDKRTKNNSLIVVTRYRYIINLSSVNSNADITEKLQSLGIQIASRFADL